MLLLPLELPEHMQRQATLSQQSHLPSMELRASFTEERARGTVPRRHLSCGLLSGILRSIMLRNWLPVPGLLLEHRFTMLKLRRQWRRVAMVFTQQGSAVRRHF